MKVKFSFPVLGVLALKNTKPITLGDWKFCFRRNRKTKTINRLDIILSNVDRDSWPHLIEAKEKQTPEAVPIFPFEVQPNAFGFSKIRQTLVQLESLLGFYGVYEFDFRSVTEEWILESDDEQGSLFSKWSQSRSLPIVEPATEALLVRCIVAAGRDIPDVQSLPHFRMAQAAFHNGYFIEAVRYSYLFLEQMFGLLPVQ